MMSLIDLIEPLMSSESNAIIYVDSDSNIHTLSYCKLWSIAETIEKKINTMGIVGNSVIGIVGDVNQMIPAFIIGVLKAKCMFAYLSQNWDSPLYSTLSCIISHKKHIKKVHIDTYEQLIEEYVICRINYISADTSLRNYIHSQSEEFAYAITTSGTCGPPKLVFVPHSCIVANIIDLRIEFKTMSNDTILICSPFTFDPSIVDLFVGLSSHSQILLINNLIKINPIKLIDAIQSFKVSIMTVTPSFISRIPLDMIQNKLLCRDTDLRVLVFGGEKSLKRKIIDNYRIFNKNKTIIYNIYGVTEVSSWASIYKYDSNDPNLNKYSDLPIYGRNLLDTQILIENNECVIKSDKRRCLILGSDNNEWTDHYRTGDNVIVSDSGHIYFTGRTDSINKINGNKINLQQIEDDILNHFSDSVMQCVCLSGQWNHIENSIINVAIIRCNDCDRSEILKFLSESYSHFTAFRIVFMSEFPLTIHNKIDRYALSVRINQIQSKSYGSRINPIYTKEDIEKCVVKCFEFCFNKTLCIDDMESAKLIYYGIDSMKALQFAVEIEHELRFEFPSLFDKIINYNLKQVFDYIHDTLTNELIKENDNLRNFHATNLKRKLENNSQTSSTVMVISRRGMTNNGDCESYDTSKRSKLYYRLEIEWTFDLSQCIDASPLIIRKSKDNAFAFIGSHSGQFVCIEIESGNLKWKTQLKDRIESSACTDFSGQLIYVGDYDGNFYCISSDSGLIVWTFKTNGAIKCSPICSRDLVFCGSHDQHLYAWNLFECDHQQYWKCHISDGSIFSSPILSEDETVIYAATLNGIFAAIDTSNGLITWKIQLKSPLFSSPSLFNNTLIIGTADSKIHSINCADGSVKWSFCTEKPVFSSSVIKNDSIFIGTHDNCLLCINTDGKLKWKYTVSSPIYSIPFVCDEYLVFSESKGIVHVLNVLNGQMKCSIQLESESFSSSVVYNEHILLGCRDNSLYCIKLK